MSNYAQEQAERLMRLATEDGMDTADLIAGAFAVTWGSYMLMIVDATVEGDQDNAIKFSKVAENLQEGIDAFNEEHDQQEK